MYTFILSIFIHYTEWFKLIHCTWSFLDWFSHIVYFVLSMFSLTLSGTLCSGMLLLNLVLWEACTSLFPHTCHIQYLYLFWKCLLQSLVLFMWLPQICTSLRPCIPSWLMLPREALKVSIPRLGKAIRETQRGNRYGVYEREEFNNIAEHNRHLKKTEWYMGRTLWKNKWWNFNKRPDTIIKAG